MICTLVTWKPYWAEIVEKATTAAAIGEHVMPICEAILAMPHGPFGTDAFLQGNVANNWHEGVDHMTGTDEHSEEERGERRKKSDAVGMLAEQALCNLYHPVHTPGSLQHTRTGHGCDDNVDDIRRRIARFEVKTKDQYSQTYTRDGTKCQRAIARAYPKGDENYQQLNNH